MKISSSVLRSKPAPGGYPGRIHILALALMAFFAGGFLIAPAQAQTVTITPETLNYWAGVNTSYVLGVGSNLVSIASADGTAYSLAVSGQPAGLTAVLGTNSCTNNIQLALFLSETNVAAGTYPLTLSATGESSYSTNVTFRVVPQWIATNAGSTGNWSVGTNWSSGAPPAATDAVYVENNIADPFTNIVDTSFTIQSLVFLGDADDASYPVGVNTTIATNVTLSVVGTNGFFIGRKNSSGERPFYTFSGPGTLVVSNTAANFGVVDASADATRYLTVNMTNLNNLNVTVNRFGVGDATLSYEQGAFNGSQTVNFYAARTNIITALFVDNYTNVDFNTSIQYDRQTVVANNGETTLAAFNLGITNAIYADSVGVGRGSANGSGSAPFGFGAYPMKFGLAFSNSAAPTASALFRNVNGGRMSLLAIAVDSGTSPGLAENAGYIDLRGGVVDMQVDQIWLARNRTNSAAKACLGGLYFDWGTINANTIIAGNMLYTNQVSSILGCLLVGTNGTLIVNSNLVLGLTPQNVTGFASQAAAVSGDVQINNGGTIKANNISVGQFGTNNIITINSGGTLIVSNNIASAGTPLTSLTNNGGALTLNINGTDPLAYVANLDASAPSAINISSVSGISSFPVTISVIKYGTATTPNNWVGGTGPAGLFVGVANNAANNSIDVTLSTGAPKNLLWKGYVNNSWDLSTANWLDLTTGLHTNFATLDSVSFDDTASSGTINISGDVVPSQSVSGIQFSNNVLSYTLTGSGEILGGSTVTLYGTGGLTVGLYTEFGVNVNVGHLSVIGGGTIGSANIATGATFSNGGTVLGGVACAGIASNGNVIDGELNVETSGDVTNLGNVYGPLAIQSGGYFDNVGTLDNVGTATTQTNSILVNNGVIYGTSLTIGGVLIDLAQDSIGVNAGSINLGTLTINGTFEPGGSNIGITAVTDYDANGDQLGNPNGRILLNAGSVTVLQVNPGTANTILLSQNQGFGASQVSRGVNGGTLLITNVGTTPFAAGQTFKFFGQYYNNGNIQGAGLNTTNTYPVVQPQTPGPGLVWDLSNLIPGGTIGVINASAVQNTLTNSFTFANGSNIITSLAWQSNFAGYGWVQQQITALTNGLGTNWSNVGASDYTNSIVLTNTIIGSQAVFYRFIIP